MKPEDRMLTVDQVGRLFGVSHDTARRRMKGLGVEGEPRLGAARSAMLYPADVLIAKLREHRLERQARIVENFVAELDTAQ